MALLPLPSAVTGGYNGAGTVGLSLQPLSVAQASARRVPGSPRSVTNLFYLLVLLTGLLHVGGISETWKHVRVRRRGLGYTRAHQIMCFECAYSVDGRIVVLILCTYMCIVVWLEYGVVTPIELEAQEQ